MNKAITYLVFLIIISFSSQAQILNGGFEQWSGGEPSYWLSNNVDEPDITITPITRSSSAHSGSSCLKGEVIEYEIQGITVTYPPQVQSGNETVLGFPYNGRPQQIRGYYNFTSVGGDAFVNNVFLMSGNNVLAVGGLTKHNSTGDGWHELIMDLNYIDTVTTPNKIAFNFQIIPQVGTNQTHLGSEFYIDDFPKMTLIKPPGDEEPLESGTEQIVFIAGEKDTIKWNAGGALNVDIKYSVDNGATYNQIVSNYPADSSKYIWAVPGSLLTRKAKVKLVETQNTDNKVESVRFTIKPWQLTRLDAGNNLELFKPNQDGWSFGNTSANAWPQSWWTQFNYFTGDDPNTGTLYPFNQPFRSANRSDHPDWPMYVDVFTISQCYNDNLPSIYSSRATTSWSGNKGSWGGSCYGFAVSSLIGFYYTNNLIAQFPGIGNFSSLFNVSLSTDARRAVNHYYTHQYSQEDNQHYNNHIGDTPQQLLTDLKKMFQKENGDGQALSFFNNVGSGGHTVVPYKLERIGNSPTFNLRVYDSNNPGSVGQIIFIDSANNQWRDQTGLNWGTGSSGCYLEPESISYLFIPTLRPTQLKSLHPKQTLNGLSKIKFYNSSNAEIIITSHNGNQMGYLDSIPFNNILNAHPIIPKTGKVHPPIGYYVPQDEYSIQMGEFEDSVSYMFFITDSTIYNYRRFDANNNEIDVLSYTLNGIGINNPDPINKNTILETIIIEDSTSEKVFVTSNFSLSAGDSIHIREKDRNELLLQNYGENMNYDLEVRIASDNNQFVFLHTEIPMAQNSAHQIVPVWENLNNEPVKILIDLGNDGIIDDTLSLINQLTGIGEDQGSLLSPKSYNLAQNYPNPFNPVTTIKYSIPKTSNVLIKVFDVLGNEITILINEEKPVGTYELNWNAANLPSGVYFYRLQAGSFVETKKMILLK